MNYVPPLRDMQFVIDELLEAPFDAAQGFFISEPNRGLAAVFVMMNSARLNVGIQGLGHAEMANQNALRYAGERQQMRAVAHPPGAVGASASGRRFSAAGGVAALGLLVGARRAGGGAERFGRFLCDEVGDCAVLSRLFDA